MDDLGDEFGDPDTRRTIARVVADDDQALAEAVDICDELQDEMEDEDGFERLADAYLSRLYWLGQAGILDRLFYLAAIVGTNRIMKAYACRLDEESKADGEDEDKDEN